ALHQPGDLRGGVVEVARHDRVGGAHHRAGGLEAHLHPMRAVVALGRGAGLGIDVDRVVGARLHAGLAADAHVLVELHDAVGALVHRGHGADPHAGRVVTVVAARDLEAATH